MSRNWWRTVVEVIYIGKPVKKSIVSHLHIVTEKMWFEYEHKCEGKVSLSWVTDSCHTQGNQNTCVKSLESVTPCVTHFRLKEQKPSTHVYVVVSLKCLCGDDEVGGVVLISKCSRGGPAAAYSTAS